MAVPLTGAVYDRGYRPYDGPRGGRRAAALALYRASMRRALGLRRPWRQKVFPWTLLAIVSVPAIINVGISYLTRNNPARTIEIITHRQYVGVSTALLLFVGLTAPDVICPDRRHHVLPLIFARPLVGRDYVFAKVGAIATIVFAFGFLPQVLLFVGQMLVTKNGALSYLTANSDVLWQVPVAVALLAIYYAVVAVAVSSLTTRRIVAGASLLGLLLVSSSVSSVLMGERRSSAAALINVLALPLGLRDLVFLGRMDSESPLSGVQGAGWMLVGAYTLVLVVGMAVLLRRYRWVEH
jgi:ABC-2 type transport system permease protein